MGSILYSILIQLLVYIIASVSAVSNGTCGYILSLDVKPPLILELRWNSVLTTGEITNLQNIRNLEPRFELHIREISASIVIEGYFQKPGENRTFMKHVYESEISLATFKLRADEFITNVSCQPYKLSFDVPNPEDNCSLEIPSSKVQAENKKLPCAILHSERNCRGTTNNTKKLLIYSDETVQLTFPLRSLLVNPNCVLNWISSTGLTIFASYRNIVDEFQYTFSNQNFNCTCYNASNFDESVPVEMELGVPIDVASDVPQIFIEADNCSGPSNNGYNWGAFFTGAGISLVLSIMLVMLVIYRWDIVHAVRRLRTTDSRIIRYSETEGVY